MKPPRRSPPRLEGRRVLDFLGPFGIILALLWTPPLPAQRPEIRASRVDPAVREAVRAEGRALVFVNGKPPGAFSTARERRDAIRSACRRLEARLPGPASAAVRRRFDWIPSLLLEVRDESCLSLLEGLEDIASVHLDVRGRGALLESGPYIHAPEAHALGFDGEGAIAAVLDSGADIDHPSLSGAIIHTYRFLDQGQDSGPEPERANDGHGHGTNVAGIIASRGGAAPAGIAPEAKLVIVKVLDDDNTGWLSDWALGVNHVIGLKLDQGIRVDAINMSLVSNGTYAGECDGRVPAFAAACSAARDAGIAVFAASGNNGERGLMTIPACYSSVISVGSVRDTLPDRLSSFTNRNEFLDLLAPGERITSTGIGGGSSTFMGTSQATPHAAAVACILREVDGSITPDAVKEVLWRSGRPYFDSGTGLTFPLLDAEAAVEAMLVPRVTGLHCTFADAKLGVEWDVVEGADHLHVEVAREGVQVLLEDLPGGATGLEEAAAEPGQYLVCVRALGATGLQGLEECCTVTAAPSPVFLRSDCNQDGRFNIGDPVRLVVSLFAGGSPPACAAACDANDDDRIDISDAIFPLNYLFSGGPAPPEPFPACGEDAGGAPLGCAQTLCP